MLSRSFSDTILSFASLLALSNETLIAQQAPTGTPPANITGAGLPDVRDNAQRSWYRGGNPNIGNGATSEHCGTAQFTREPTV